MYPVASVSPRVAGARPWYSSDDKTLMFSIILAALICFHPDCPGASVMAKRTPKTSGAPAARQKKWINRSMWQFPRKEFGVHRT
jgi:hypothetical protein